MPSRARLEVVGADVAGRGVEKKANGSAGEVKGVAR